MRFFLFNMMMSNTFLASAIRISQRTSKFSDLLLYFWCLSSKACNLQWPPSSSEFYKTLTQNIASHNAKVIFSQWTILQLSVQ